MNIINYLDSIDIIYWINLDRSEKRRKNMETILKKINIKNERIPATDGKNISDEELYNNFKFLGEKNASKIEYSCLLSHLRTIQKFSESNYNIALILEDDLSLEYSKYWDKKISEIIKGAPEDWEIIMLNYVTLKPLEELYTKNENGFINCAGSYLINKKAVQKFMKNTYIDKKFVLKSHKSNTADNYIFSELITYTYKYPYFTYPKENESTIHNEHILYHNTSKYVANSTWGDKYKLPIYLENLYFIIKLKEIIIIIIITFILIKILKTKKIKTNK